jgi:hypothetical protein
MDIIALVLVVITAAIFGGLVGWFSRGRICLTIFICLAAPAIFLGGLAILSPHDHYSLDAWVAVFVYSIVPFIFLAVPCVIGGTVMACSLNWKKHRVTFK